MAADRRAIRPAVMLALLGVLAGGPALAKSPTVAVMPFRDLGSDSRFTGEAIRETVMSDLKQLGGLRVVERASLDRVLVEQRLQHGSEMAVSDIVRVGKVLGAQLIVVGAYQKLAPQVRLTARFIKVETSEVIGTAKVDGSQHEFLRLQDRVTAALLRSAGLPLQAKQVLDESAQRPDLQSMKTLDLYGQAVVATDDGERRNLLKLVVAEDKSFSYALKELAALEKRLESYQSEQDQVVERDLQEDRRQLALLTDRPQIEQRMVAYLLKLFQSRHYRTLAKESRVFVERVAPGMPITQPLDQAAYYLVMADQLLKDDDAVLRDGESYLRRAPGSTMFAVIKQLMEAAIAHKRTLEQGKDKVVKDLAGISSEARWDLYLVAQLYGRNQQHREAQRLLRACLRLGKHPPVEVLQSLTLTDWQLGDWAGLRTDLAALERLDTEKAHSFRGSWGAAIPVDG